MHEELAGLLLKYMGKDTIGEIYRRIEEIAEAGSRRKVRFLCGAGMSRASGIIDLRIISLIYHRM